MTVQELYDEIKNLVDNGKGIYDVVVLNDGVTENVVQCIYISNKNKKISII